MDTIYLRAFRHPPAVFRELNAHPRPVRQGFYFVGITIIAYTMMYVFLTAGNGAPSVFKPWLNISAENYYAVNRFLLAPSMLLSWFACAVVMHLLARSAGGTGTFEQTFMLSGLAISMAMWAALVHDLPMSLLSALQVIDARQHEIDMNSPTIFRTLLWICYGLYMLAFLYLFPLAVKTSQRVSARTAILTGVTGFVIFHLIFFVFNR